MAERLVFISIGDGWNGISMTPGEKLYAVKRNGEKFILGTIRLSDDGSVYLEDEDN
jgi:hypothetical protein